MIDKIKPYYERNLPHYQPSYADFFVTFRLAGSIPVSVVTQLMKERELEGKRIAQITNQKAKLEEYHSFKKEYFLKFDGLLDKSDNGPNWLKIPEIANILNDAIKYRDEKDYQLIAFTIMSNHVHMVISTERKEISLYKILQSLKRHTARESNKLLARTGAFWHHESYDHVIRNDKELVQIVKYVLNNPVKAGLVKSWQEWKWSYTKYGM
jgi:REP element-mobilizing transposase RayT